MDLSSEALSNRVRWCAIEDAVFVLDIDAGEYFALGPEMAISLLRLTQGKTVDQDDLQELRARGWLEPKKHLRGRKSRVWPNFLRNWPCPDAFATILATRVRMKVWGFAAAYRWAEDQPQLIEVVPAKSDIADDLAMFLRAEGLLPSRLGNFDCLPRSLSLYSFLKRRGHDVEHIIGIGRFPFDAHAWVSKNGAPLLEFNLAQPEMPGLKKLRGRAVIATLT